MSATKLFRPLLRPQSLEPDTAGESSTHNDRAVKADGVAHDSQLTGYNTGDQLKAEEAKRGKRGRLSNLIYGTAEARQLDSDIERSFSEVVARGKYVHSIVFHEVKPDKVEEYVNLVGKWYPRMASIDANKVKLVGSWRTQVGDNDTFGNVLMSPSIPNITLTQFSFKCTFGNTKDMKDTIRHCTKLDSTRSSQSSTEDSRL
ncbi:hypothetical protein KEM56_001186 [Ascosphaera pollenicola]|nr:hypothetical protein KEM56_001186 [Ascosphaera pollenicola]